MLASAILLIEPATSDSPVSSISRDPVPAFPLACCEVLGESAVERTIQRLQSAGIGSVTVLAPSTLSDFVNELGRRYRGIRFVPSSPSTETNEVNTVFEQIEKVADRVVVVKMGAYVEFDLAALLEIQHTKRESVIRVHGDHGPLDVWLVNLRSGPTDIGTPWFSGMVSSACPVKGYVNQLLRWQDLHSFGIDILLARCEAKPFGRQKAPGIWLAEEARVHRDAELIAPVYVGRSSVVGASARVNGMTSIESRCEVGAGTTVEDSLILPRTRIGVGLHVSHAIVDGACFVDIRQNIAVKVSDAKLLSTFEPPRRWFTRSVPIRSKKAATQPSGLNRLPFRGAALPKVMGFLEDEL